MASAAPQVLQPRRVESKKDKQCLPNKATPSLSLAPTRVRMASAARLTSANRAAAPGGVGFRSGCSWRASDLNRALTSSLLAL